MRRPTILGSLLLIAAIACVQTHAVLIDKTAPRLPPTTPDSVRIFTLPAELDTLDYVRVAMIEASGDADYTSRSAMLEAMRKKAASLGANGILLPDINEPRAWEKIAGAVLKTGADRTGQAVAIRVKGRKPQ